MVTCFEMKATRRRNLRRVGVSAIAIAGLLPLIDGAHAAPQPEPAAVAQRIWGALLTRCADGHYFYGGSAPLDSGGMLADAQMRANPVMEFEGPAFHLVPIRVSDAERANGIQYRGRMTMIAHLYRRAGERWSDGPAARRRDMDDILGQVLASATGEFFGMGQGGSMAVQLVKFKGRWAFARGSTDFASGFGAGSDFQFVDTFMNARLPRYSCKEAKVVLPPPSTREVAQNRASTTPSDDE